LDRRLGGPQNRSGRGGEDKNSKPPPGIELQNPESTESKSVDDSHRRSTEAFDFINDTIINMRGACVKIIL
jgi:hypothetical protein